jgi:hypothetical protein
MHLDVGGVMELSDIDRRPVWPGPARARTIAAVAITCASLSALAILPLLAAGLGKQIIKNMIMNEVKGQLIATLARQGCKGAKLIAVFSEAERMNLVKTGPVGLPGGMMSSAGMARGGMPPGMAGGAAGMSAGGPGAGGSAGGSGGLFGSLKDKLRGVGSMMDRSDKAAESAAGPIGGAAGSGALVAPAGGPMGIGGGSRPGIVSTGPVGPNGPNMAELMAQMQRQAGGRGQQMTPEQMERASQVMGQMQDSMAHPLTRAETLEVFDQLRGMGMLPDDMYAEARDCIMLADESASQGIGATGAMFKSVVLPQLVDMKAKLAALPPEHKEQLAEQLVEALHEASPADRKAFREGLGKSFFPPEVIEKVGNRVAE